MDTRTEYARWQAELAGPTRPAPLLKWIGWFIGLAVMAGGLVTLFMAMG